MADWQTRLMEDIGFHVRVRLTEPRRMDYEARDIVGIGPDTMVPTFFRAGDGPKETENLDEAKVYMAGSIQWDGCSHNTCPGGPDGTCITGVAAGRWRGSAACSIASLTWPSS